MALLIIALIAFLILRYRKGEDRAPNAEVVEVPENEKRYGLPEIEASEYKSNHELTAVRKLAVLGRSKRFRHERNRWSWQEMPAYNPPERARSTSGPW